jgi:Uma2 family endonuclease
MATESLTLEAFHARYDIEEKPYFEYWNGEAVQKSFPTLLHARLQEILVRLLDGIGYEACFEITIKLDQHFELVPDVIAVEGRIEDPYPTEPFEIVIEILVAEDSFSRVLQKCRILKMLGIRQVLAVDPLERAVWSFENGSLRKTDVVARRDECVITAKELWAEVDRLYRRHA